MLYNVLEYLEETAKRVPERTAFTDGERGLTFRALSDSARAVGSYLGHAIPVRCPVVILMEKSAECIAAFMGAVYAGCFYVPLDSAMPAKRMQLIIDTLEPAFLIYDEKNKKTLDQLRFSCGTVSYGEAADGLHTDEALLQKIRLQAVDTDLLYVLFTSGSTGVPKGVSICHRSMLDFTEHSCGPLHFDETIRFGNQVPLHFDMSTMEIYTTLKMGATTYLIPRRCFLFPKLMMEYLETHRINTVFWVPYALLQLSNAGVLDGERLKALHYIYFCGEVMPCKHLNRYRRALPEAVYCNLYGPTEITNVCSYYFVDREFADDETLPIGIPFCNTRIFIVKEDGTEAGEGEAGEILIGGSCLSLGYYNSREISEKSFVQNPLHDRFRDMVYRTGDLGKFDESGNLIFLGRKDYQIKHQGYRIELGEIEAAVSSLEEIEHVCCFHDGEKDYIVCCYVGDVTDRDILLQIKKKVPSYMLPDRLLRQEAFPRTLTGKTDRNALRKLYEEAEGMGETR